MSILFYDHLLSLDELESIVNKSTQSEEERHELWHLIDETLYYKVLSFIFDNLPHDHHNEFLEKFYDAPHDAGLIVYINDRVEVDIEDLLLKRINELQKSLIKDLV